MEVPMKRVSIADLKPGMIAAEDVLSPDTQTVVPKSTVLTENIIVRLENYCIYYVVVEDEAAYDLACPLTSGTSDFDEKSSCFIGAFKRCSEHYHAVLTNSIAKNEPFCSDDLLREVVSLRHQDGSIVNIFNILLNLRSTDNTIYSHCIGVALISNVFSRWLGFTKEEQLTATACGLFHDCGMLMLPSVISEKTGHFTQEELAIIKTHPIEGFHLLSKYRSISETVRDTALTHHERCDASGYPYGLSGSEISKFTKLVMIADIFDSMIVDKTCRLSMCPLSLIKYFNDSGFQKYEADYVLTFLENILNLFLEHKVTLCSGMDENVIFVNRGTCLKPPIRLEGCKDRDLQKEYYNSILLLSNMENLSIESII